MGDLLDVAKWPELATKWRDFITVVALVLGGLWALRTFRRNNHINAAELVLDLEEKYGKHKAMMLAIEQLGTYQKDYSAVLEEAMNDNAILAPKTLEKIEEIDKMLRFFYICYRVKRLGVDAGMVDHMCAYYLPILASPKRPELRAYIKKYFPTVYFWAPLAGRPCVVRSFVRVTQIKERLAVWLKRFKSRKDQ
jgi:hypothetical protein